MKVLGSIVWLLFVGIIVSLVWLIVGIVFSLTIVGIPFAIQCFKISRYVLWPFGNDFEP